MLLRRPSPCTHIFDPAFSPLGLCFQCRGVVLLRALRGGGGSILWDGLERRGRGGDPSTRWAFGIFEPGDIHQNGCFWLISVRLDQRGWPSSLELRLRVVLEFEFAFEGLRRV